MNKVYSKIKELYKEIDSLEKTSMNSKDKNAQIELLNILINNTYKSAYENVGKLGDNINKYKITDDNVDDVYYFALADTFGAETSIKIYGDKLYEKAKTLYDNNKVSYEDFLNIYLDVRGSKKSEVEEYLKMYDNLTKAQKNAIINTLF